MGLPPSNWDKSKESDKPDSKKGASYSNVGVTVFLCILIGIVGLWVGAAVIFGVILALEDAGVPDIVIPPLFGVLLIALVVGGIYLLIRLGQKLAANWNCSECETENNSRAKSCTDCGTKR